MNLLLSPSKKKKILLLPSWQLGVSVYGDFSVARLNCVAIDGFSRIRHVLKKSIP